ncbi:MAG TPA: UDP-3-O-(3-hydroxymyristoyl)glucosamine N-acyltransferase, partial [Verrucomicrobiae bacterium]|nr:UDP-3-O-(3-hydroxymyristoyl)glucosamine N-acyltransferase [Verrucomicrobiae bacterium]
MPFTAAEIAKTLSGQVVGEPETVLKGFAPADRAQPGDLTFAENESYFARAVQSAASAILIDGPFESTAKVLIKVPNARIAFAKVLPLFFPEPRFPAGVHPTAVMPADAQVHPSAHIGPHCVLESGVKIGAQSVLQGGNHVGMGCKLGEAVNLFPNVTLYPATEIGNRVRIHSGTVIGADGFGYVFDAGSHRKVPQIGNVIIRDDVEIGANVTIDRGALGPTIVGRGTKIDNLVQIAHNVTLGEHCLIVSQAGIAGSTKLGNYVILGGQ